MLPLRFFSSRAFSAANGASVAMYFGMFGSIFLLTQYLQTVHGYSPLGAGLRMLAWTGRDDARRAGRRHPVGPHRRPAADGGGLALQAVALGWMAAIVDADRLRTRASSSRSSSPASAWASSSPRSRTSSSRRCGRRSRARPRARTTRCASSAASSASPSSRRSSRTAGARSPTAAAQLRRRPQAGDLGRRGHRRDRRAAGCS